MDYIYKTINLKPETKKRFRRLKFYDEQSDDELMNLILDEVEPTFRGEKKDG
jgi:hypothetical protein